MTSVCLLVVYLFSEQGETMQCAVWQDEHEHKAKTETNQNRGFNFQQKKIKQIRKKNFFYIWKTENRHRNRNFGMKKTENRTDF